MQVPTDLRELLDAARPGHALPRPFYRDASVLEADLATLHCSDWLFAIAACEVARAGDFVTHRIGAYSIVIVRQKSGEIAAFHNVCRHRGAQLCEEASGRAMRLVCPYHQWSYELDGRLLFARDMGESFDKAEHGLKPVHCRQVSGLVFVCLAERAPDIEPFAEASHAALHLHGLDRARVAHRSVIVEEGNWKLVFENNRECYHCAVNHPALSRTFLDDPALIGNSDESGPAMAADPTVARCEEAGAASGFTLGDGGQWRYVRMPLIGDAESYTMSGKVAVRLPLARFPFRDAGALLMFHYPSTWCHFLSDHAILFRVTPLSPTRTEVSTCWLVHQDAVEGTDYLLDDLVHVWRSTNDEDRRVVELCQQGVESPAYQPGPYSKVHEGGVIQFNEWYRRRMAELA